MKKALLIILTFIIAAAAVFAFIAFQTVIDSFTYVPPVENENKPAGDDNVMNILFMGTDKKIEGTNDRGRCDSTMMCSLNLKTGAINLISFERGISVPANQYEYDLLTNVYSREGPEAMVSVMENHFKIPVDGYAHVDFDTFAAVIDALGGITIELTAEEAAALNGEAVNSVTYAWEHMVEGANTMCGNDAVLYCRLRSIDSDWERQARQRNMMTKIIEHVRGTNPIKLVGMLKDVLPNVETSLT